MSRRNPTRRVPRGAARTVPYAGRRRRLGFTLIELLVVILVIALLAALLLPAITGAIRTAKNAAVQAEISQMAQALADFKSKYGEYPPSRILLAENGYYNTQDTTPIASISGFSGETDMTVGQLAARSLTYLRRFFPRVALSTSQAIYGPGPPATINPSVWLDFNGNNLFDNAPLTGMGQNGYVLQGHECLVFFLGGIPQQTSAGTYGMTGFAKNPQNPFLNATVAPNRQPPLFEFNGARLVADPTKNVGIPGYVDSLGNQYGFYAYFSAYGSNGYDPNDVNFPEVDETTNTSPMMRNFFVNFPVYTASGGSSTFAGAGGTQSNAVSPSPNPYTSGPPADPAGKPTIYQNPQTFQIVSSGSDGIFGIGGIYVTNTSSEALPLTSATSDFYSPSTNNGLRTVERDNLTNFKNGKLE